MIYLTEKYKNFFNINGKNSIINIITLLPNFISDLFKSGKIREISSFVIWELMHKFKIFPKDSYVQIQDSNHLIIDKHDDICSIEFSNKIKQFNQSNEYYNIDVIKHNLTICFFDSYNDTYYAVDTYDDNNLLISSDGLAFEFYYRFDYKIFSIFMTKSKILLVNSGNKIYKKNINANFDFTLELSSNRSFLRDNGCITEDNHGNIYIAEYGLDWDENKKWKSLSYLYISRDNSETWERIDLFKDMGANKHLHLIFFDLIHNALILTDGDNHKRLWINYSLVDINKRAYRYGEWLVFKLSISF